MAVKATEEQIHPSRKEFLALAKAHTLVPVYRTLIADLETPVSAFLRAAWPERECFLLESVEGGEQVGRYTFIGINPYKRIVARGRRIAITEGKRTTQIEGDIFAVLRDALGGHKPARLAGMPPFTAGAVGFFAYDAVRQIERLPELAKDELGVPDACLLFFDEVLAFDHVRKQIWLMVTADVTLIAPEKAYADAVRRLEQAGEAAGRTAAEAAQGEARRKAQGGASHAQEGFSGGGGEDEGVHPRRRRVSDRAVAALRCGAGTGYVPGVSLAADGESEPLYVLFAVHAGGRRWEDRRAELVQEVKRASAPIELAGSSPELLVRVHDRKVEYRPIAGTRPRGANEAEDLALEEEMMHDEKERAEHVMLVDLGRNDVGRVSEFGSVKVDRLMFVERYSHVMHIVSTIEGKLRKELTAVDALRACFPAGTLSGAPKVRAMEIIEELEPARRGTYGGAVLYADFSGNLDSCIAIRSLLAKDGKGYMQAGAGIVADSVPEMEYEESLNKAQAVIRAIKQAQEL